MDTLSTLILLYTWQTQMHLNNSLNDQTYYFKYHCQLKTNKKKEMIPFTEFFFHYVYGFYVYEDFPQRLLSWLLQIQLLLGVLT